MRHGDDSLARGATLESAARLAAPQALRYEREPAPLRWQVAEPDGDYAGDFLLPGEQPWARRHLEAAEARHWSPAEVTLARDAEAWATLAPEARAVLQHGLHLLALLDRVLSREGPTQAAWRLVESADCRRLLDRQAWDEGQRAGACRRIAAALALTPETGGPLPEACAHAARLGDWLATQAALLGDAAGGITDAGTARNLAAALGACLVAAKATLVPLVSIQGLCIARHGRLEGSARLFRHLLRDEMAHLQFGLSLLRAIRETAPRWWDPQLEATLRGGLVMAADLAIGQAYATLPRGLPGLNAPMLEEYLLFAANRCCRALGLAELQPDAANPFFWIAELRPPRGTGKP